MFGFSALFHCLHDCFCAGVILCYYYGSVISLEIWNGSPSSSVFCFVQDCFGQLTSFVVPRFCVFLICVCFLGLARFSSIMLKIWPMALTWDSSPSSASREKIWSPHSVPQFLCVCALLPTHGVCVFTSILGG